MPMGRDHSMLARWKSLLLVSIAFGTVAAAEAPVQQNPEPVPDATEDGKYPIGRDFADRMTIEVEVNGKGPFNFLIDTGAERTIVSRQLRDEVGLRQGVGLKVRSVLGAKETPTAHIDHLRLSNRIINVNNSPVLDARHIGADGILGLDTLKRQRVTFDFKKDEVHVAPSSLRTDETEDFAGDAGVERVSVPARMKNGNLVFTHSRIKSVDVPVVVDTGAEVSIGNTQLKRLLRLHGTSELRSNRMTQIRFAQLETVTGESGEVEVALIDRLYIGGVEFRDLLVAFAPTKLFEHLGYDNRPAILLGMDALRRFDRVQVDFGARKVRFDLPVQGYREAGETRMVDIKEMEATELAALLTNAAAGR